ncbi:hypothetical protein RUND412_004762 [Rhizina undulata]
MKITPDSRWRAIPTFWILSIQVLCILGVLGISAHDISFVRDTLAAQPSRRLVLNVVCSVFSLLNIALHLFLYLKESLNPLLSVIINTLLAFFWVALCSYQNIALDNLRGILYQMCPSHYKYRMLWCQNPKMTLSFSIMAL